ncbi:MAG: phage baseplate assembly protein [Candidatus Omnitrophica bacterium]|nr:phage baseplate assembly protein [Candidatus Omnitrophota bacterium]
MNIFTTLSNKIYSMIGRAILTAINNSGKVQRIQVKGIYEETLTDIDRIQEYGLETYPEISGDTEVIIVCPDGNREQAIAIKVGTRASRPTDLNEGEVKLYTKFGNKILLGDDGKIELNGNDKELVLWGPLNTALQAIVSGFNAELMKKQDMAGAPGSQSLDISAAKTTTIVTGG